MGVPIEEHDTFNVKQDVTVTKVRRAAAGSWTATIDIGVCVTLDDGRKVTFTGPIQLARGRGTRKPVKQHNHPDRRAGKSES